MQHDACSETRLCFPSRSSTTCQRQCSHRSELDGIATSRSSRVRLDFLGPKPSLRTSLDAEKEEAETDADTVADAEAAALQMKPRVMSRLTGNA